MHASSTSMLLLLHSAFMLRVVKILLKGEVGGHALKVMEITLLIMEHHGKIVELYFLIFVGTLFKDLDHAPFTVTSASTLSLA